MGIPHLIALRLGRATYPPASLAAAAFLMTLVNPYRLWDAGFQLSFAATLGLVLYTQPLERAFERALARVTSAERAEKIVGLTSEALLVTMAAQITTQPIILSVFGRLSLVTLLTNFLILPIQSFVMIFGGFVLLSGLLYSSVATANTPTSLRYLYPDMNTTSSQKSNYDSKTRTVNNPGIWNCTAVRNGNTYHCRRQAYPGCSLPTRGRNR